MKYKTYTYLGYAEQHGKRELTDANSEPTCAGSIEDVREYLFRLKSTIKDDPEGDSFWWKVHNGTSYCGQAAIAAINEELTAMVDRATIDESEGK